MTDQDENPACATGKIRLYVGADLRDGSSILLGKDQSHYLVNVMRRSDGDPVIVFNGSDGEWLAALDGGTKKAVQLSLRTQTREQDTVPDLHLYFAPVKRAPLDFLVQKATELGVAALRPVMTRRTNVARVNEDRLRATAIEAAEQCGRLTVPDVHAVSRLETIAQEDDDRHIMFCDEGGAPSVREALTSQPNGPWAVLIGPEGGFDPAERDMLRTLSRVVPVSLGPRIMRADTAAIAALTLWQAELGDL